MIVYVATHLGACPLFLVVSALACPGWQKKRERETINPRREQTADSKQRIDSRHHTQRG